MINWRKLMGSYTARLTQKGLIKPPAFLHTNIHYEVMMGSVAYGVSTDSSDMDIYGWCIPPKEVIFPHLAGHIEGFGRQKNRFEQFQQHHIKDGTALGGKGQEYDISIYNIVKYFSLCMENNPNMIDSLFVPEFCVLHITRIGSMVRENRRLFLHKGAFHKFKGYAYSQLHKMESKNPIGKRKEIREAMGFDVKFAYHVVRLLDEIEQILVHGDIDLQRNKEQLKAIRRGEMKEEEIRLWASEKERQLEALYHSSKLQYSPDEDAIKKLLLDCIEEHYGSLDKAIVVSGKAESVLRQIRDLIDNNI